MTSGASSASSASMPRPSLVPGFSQRQLWTVLGALILAVLLATLDTSIVTTALPTIAGQFNAFESLPWVGTAYIVSATIATPLLGKLSDLYGRRRIFQTTMTLFLAGSLLCGVAQSMGQLIAFRAFQGLGGGGIQALAFAILGDILPPRQRGRYIGYFTIAFALAALGGPLVGGTIVDHWDWHWIFLINIPLIVIAGTATHFALRLPFRRREARIDWLGAALLSAGLAMLMLGLEQGKSGWATSKVFAYFVGAGVFLVSFIGQERRAAEPMIPLRLFTNRAVVASCALGFFAGNVTYGANTFLPLYFQDALFIRPTASGLRVVPTMIGVVLMTFVTGRLIAKTGRYKIYPVTGTMAMAAGLLLIAQLTGSTPYLYLMVPMFVVGLGSGAVFTTSSIALQNACELRDLGVATATMMFFRSLGGSMGLATSGTLLNSTIRSRLPSRTGLAPAAAVKLIRAPAQIKVLEPVQRRAVIDAIAGGVSHIFWVASALMIVAALWAMTMPELPLRDKAGISDALAKANAG
jgi:EmrB/QacA subfamily drug resistance transporter